MNSFINYLEPKNKASTRIVVAVYLFLATIILQGLILVAVVLVARQLIHLGMDVPTVITVGLIVCLVLFGWVIEEFPKQSIISPRQYVAPPLVRCAPSLFFASVSFVTASPFIPPRHTSFTH